MRLIRRLRDLRKRGTPAEQKFARYLVASQLERHPDKASQWEWNRAWREAEDFWEQTVHDFDQKLGYTDLPKAERRARRQLTRVAYARLETLGWK